VIALEKAKTDKERTVSSKASMRAIAARKIRLRRQSEERWP
jgi:hypothetical protein